jgi:putative phage-type endonuclease
MQTLSVAQGSQAWIDARKDYLTASEAPAALGVSKYTTRTDLLRQKSTGIEKEIDPYTQTLFDQGHVAEAGARAMAEEVIGLELYPVTGTSTVEELQLLASFDGMSMDEEIIWEHKLYGEGLAESVRSGNLDPHYTVQMDQQLFVSGAKKCLFMTSDGTPANMAWCWYESSKEKFDALIAGWKQFSRDLAEYVPAVTEAKPVGRTPETMPALRIEVTGMVTASNLQAYRDHALAIFSGINRELTTDQHFADAEKTVKWCEEVESKLKAAKEHALSQTESIDALFKTIDDITAEARTVRLELDKLVTKRKVEVKDAIIVKARTAYDQHEKDLIKETGGPWIVLRQPDFAGAAKGKRTVASIQDAVDTVLANAKIEADASAKRIRANLACIKEDGAEYEFLFADKLALIGKPLEDLQLIVKARIAEHRAAEERRQEQERARIRAEEEQRAAAKVREAQEAEDALIASIWKNARRIEFDSVPYIQKAIGIFESGAKDWENDPRPRVVDAIASAREEMAGKLEVAKTREQAAQEAEAAKAAEQPAPAIAQAAPAPMAVSRPALPHAAPASVPTLRLGQINERLAPIALTAEGLATLGFRHSATDKAAKLYHESDFGPICAALVVHIQLAACASPQQQAA